VRRPSPLLLVGGFTLLTLIWGTTWAAIRLGLRGIPPLTGVALRFGIASAVLFGISPWLGVRYRPTRRAVGLWLMNAALSFCVSYGLVYWCEQWVPSGLGAVLFATFPFFVAILAHFVLPGEGLNGFGAAGIALGFSGVAVIFSEDLSLLGGPRVAEGALILLGAPITSAVSSVAIKRWGAGVHPVSLAAVPMGVASAAMGSAAWLTERGRPISFDALSVGALVYLAVFGSAVTFTLYYWLMSHIPATRVSLIAYTAPVVAVAVGSLALEEPFTTRTLAGSALVLLGVALAVTRRARA
jgi:drug/metabolite transporter (DMT)-like permease